MRLILFFLLLSLGADAQIIRANAFYRPQPSGVTFLLDAYPNAAAAYSLRKLKSTYSGSAIRIRRDSTGNAETDIGFTANGDLDTAAIKTHCRNNSCMVTTWYNQGDSTAVNFTQTTAASQPRIMTSGVIERRAGEPTIRFDVSGTADFMSVASSTAKFNYLHQLGQAAIFLVLQVGINTTNPNKNYVLLNNNNTATGRRGYGMDYRDTILNNNLRVQVTTGSGAISLNQKSDYLSADTVFLISNFIDNSTSTALNRNIIYTNGVNELKLNSQTSAPVSGNASNNLTIGKASESNSNYLNGYLNEIIIYPTDQTSNKSGIETNINNYYGLW